MIIPSLEKQCSLSRKKQRNSIPTSEIHSLATPTKCLFLFASRRLGIGERTWELEPDELGFNSWHCHLLARDTRVKHWASGPPSEKWEMIILCGALVRFWINTCKCLVIIFKVDSQHISNKCIASVLLSLFMRILWTQAVCKNLKIYLYLPVCFTLTHRYLCMVNVGSS